MQHTASPHGTNLYSLPLMQTNPDKMSRDSRDALALTNPVPEMSPEPSLTVLEPSAKSADPSCSRRELRKIQKTLHVLSDRKVQSENTDPMRTHFEVGIYRKHVTGGYFDCIRNGLGEQKAVLEAIRQATLDLTSNRAVELAGCDPDTLRQRTWLRLEPHVAAFAAIRNYDRREELVVQTVIRAVVDEALAFVGRQAAIT